MANTLLKPTKIVDQGLGLLQRELVLPRLVERKGIADFRGAKNDTVDIKIPSLLAGRDYEWRTRNAKIEVDELIEQSIAVKLDKHAYSAVEITDEELTLDITSWGTQVATPQVRAVAEKVEGYVATAMEGADFAHSVSFTPGDGSADDFSFYDAVVEARQALNQENVPAGGRVIVLGSNVEAAALKSRHLVKADEANADSVLREAVIGRILGFTVVGNVNSVDPDFAVAYHPTAFALANVAPEVPSGASAGATSTFDSIAMRWIRDYQSDYLRDRSVYSAFAGATSVEDGRIMDVESESFGDLTGKNVRAVEIEFSGS